jgi:hypothetical protein
MLAIGFVALFVGIAFLLKSRSSGSGRRGRRSAGGDVSSVIYTATEGAQGHHASHHGGHHDGGGGGSHDGGGGFSGGDGGASSGGH